MTDELRQKLNDEYTQLELKAGEIRRALLSEHVEMASGWYNGHYSRDTNGQWQREAFPIFVISVQDLCDVEISFERIAISAKLKREDALRYSYEKLLPYRFEAYGVEHYLCDFYCEGQTVELLKHNISQSDEREIGFSFYFPLETDGRVLSGFANLLMQEGFYD